MSFWANVVGVTFTVEAAFGYAWNVTPTWTNVTSEVRSIEVSRGRSDEFGEIGPGTATVTLNNRGRLFDPEHSAGPYFGNLSPLTPIRVRANGVDMYRGFVTGWLQRYEYPREAVCVCPCVDATRFLEQSILPASMYQQQVESASPNGYWPMQELGDGGGLVAAVGPNLSVGGRSNAEPTFTDLTLPLGAGRAVVAPTGSSVSDRFTTWTGAQVGSAPRAVSLWVRRGAHQVSGGPAMLFTSSSTNYMWVIGAGSGGAGDRWSVRYSNSATNRFIQTDISGPFVTLDPDVWQHVAIYADSTNLYVRVNGRQAYSAALSVGTSALPAGNDRTVIQIGTVTTDASITNRAAMSHVAWWATAPSTSTFDAHYEAGLLAGEPGERAHTRAGRILDDVGWPAGLRTLDTKGKSRLGAYLPASRTARDALRDVAAAERGLLFVDKSGNVTLQSRNARLKKTSVNTYADTSATARKYQDVTIDANTVESLRNTAVVTWSGGSVTATDVTSVNAYGKSIEQAGSTLLTRRRAAEQIGAFIVRTGKNPQTRVTQLVISVRRNASTLSADMAALELGDTITVQRTPQGIGSAISERLTVQGINHRITVDEWTTTLYLSPALDAYNVAPYLTAGDATYGKAGNTAANLVPA